MTNIDMIALSELLEKFDSVKPAKKSILKLLDVNRADEKKGGYTVEELGKIFDAADALADVLNEAIVDLEAIVENLTAEIDER